MTAPNLVAYTSGTTSSNALAITVTTPTHSEGDLLLVAVTQDTSAATFSASGWTSLYNEGIPGGSATFAVLYRTANVAEPSTFDVNSDISERMVYIAWSVGGSDGAIDVAAASPATGDGATVSFPSITPSVADTLAFALIATDRLSGGALGEDYDVVNRVMTAGGRIDDRTLLIRVRQQ